MRFQERELTEHAEPVEAHQLMVNEIYFTVQFADERLLVPVVEPLIFLGKNLEKPDDDLLYFQNYGS